MACSFSDFFFFWVDLIFVGCGGCGLQCAEFGGCGARWWFFFYEKGRGVTNE